MVSGGGSGGDFGIKGVVDGNGLEVGTGLGMAVDSLGVGTCVGTAFEFVGNVLHMGNGKTGGFGNTLGVGVEEVGFGNGSRCGGW